MSPFIVSSLTLQFFFLCILLLNHEPTVAFVKLYPSHTWTSKTSSSIVARANYHSTLITKLQSNLKNQQQQTISTSVRETILKRNGRYFKLDRISGKIHFGTTVSLSTRLTTPESLKHKSPIHQWLSKPREVALSIWEKSMITELSSDTYRLQLMTLQFVTIQLTPTVDTRMWTEMTSSSSPNNPIPLFKIQSFQFDPNIQIFPGVGISSKELGIEITVVGELQPNVDQSGVIGKIGFVSGGILPPPLRILPDFVLQTAAEAISQTTATFAIHNFQQGTQLRYRDFIRNIIMNG